MQFLALVVVCVGASLAVPAPPLPGLFTAAGDMGSLAMRGYDPILGQPKADILKYTYTNQNGDNNQWQDPEDGTVYTVPDQVLVTNLPSSSTTFALDEFTSISEWESWEFKESWSSFSIIVVSFSHASMSSYVKQLLKGNGSTVMHADWVDTTYKLESSWNPLIIKHEIQAGSQQNSTFALDQAALPSTRTSDADLAAYDAFVAKYGTHWVHDAVFGGRVHALCHYNKSLVASHTTAWAASQTSFSMWAVFVAFGFDTAHTHAYSNITSDFADNSDMVIIGSGGQAAYIEEGNYSYWSSSVHSNPAPLNSTYLPIADLIVDPVKASLFAAHVDQYLGKAPGAPWNNTMCGSNLGSAMKTKDIPHSSKVDMGALKAGALAKPAPAPARPVAVPSTTVPLPGLDSGIGHGYDVKTGNFMDAVTSFQYTQGKSYYNPVNGDTYTIPDGLDFIDMPSSCFVETTYDIRSDSEFAEAMTSMTGFDIGISYDGFTLGVAFGRELAKAKAITNDWTKGMSLLLRNQALYKLSYSGNPDSFDSAFASLVEALPSTASPDYQAAIQYWGTHVVTGMELGGACNFTVLYDSSFASKSSKSFVSTQIGLEFGFLLKGVGINLDLGFGFTHMTGKTNSSFIDESNSTYACVGGDVALLESKQYDQWIASMLSAPAAIPSSLHLAPLSQFIYDPVKRSLMNDAIKDYLSAK